MLKWDVTFENIARRSHKRAFPSYQHCAFYTMILLLLKLSSSLFVIIFTYKYIIYASKNRFCYTQTRACWKSWRMISLYWSFPAWNQLILFSSNAIHFCFKFLKSQTGSFPQNRWRLLAVNCFSKKLQSYNFTKMNCFTCMFHRYI